MNWYDTFGLLDTDPLIQNVYSRRLHGRVAPSGHTWSRLGGALSTPYFDRVGVYTDVGVQSAPKFTYNGTLYTPTDFPDTAGSTTNLLHPTTLDVANSSIYYLSTVSTSRLTRVAMRYDVTGYWFGAKKSETAAVPMVLLHLDTATNSFYRATYDPLTATWYFWKFVNGVATVSVSGTLHVSSYHATGTDIGEEESIAGIQLEVLGDLEDQVVISVYSGDTVAPLYHWTNVYVYTDPSPLAAGYVGMHLDVGANWGGASPLWFSAVSAPLPLAGGAFDQAVFQPLPYSIQSDGYRLIEGDLEPYQFSWTRTLISDLTVTQIDAESDGSLLDLDPPYDLVWNGSAYVDGPTTYEYEQTIYGVKTLNTAAVAGEVPVITGSCRITLVPPSWPTTVPETVDTGPVYIPYRQQSFSMGARIVAAPLGSNGIQTFSLGDPSTTTAGRSHLLRHNNGDLYLIYAESPVLDGEERCLYMQASSDNGTTWGTATCITTGFWDDAPCAVNLDGTSTSDIGIVFNRSVQYHGGGAIPYLYRMRVDLNGGLIGGIDPITDSPSYFSAPTLVRKTDGFLLAAANADITVSFWENPDFDTDGWILRTDFSASLLTDVPGWSGAQRPIVQAVTLRTLANGDILALVTVAADMNNKSLANIGFTAPPRNWRRFEVYAAISSDEGDNWSSFQRLTRYSDTPTLTIDPTLGVATADALQLSDGRILVMAAETAEKKQLTPDTAPAYAYPPNVLTLHYMTDKGVLLLASDGDGLHAIKLSTGVTKKFSTDTSPTFWGNTAVCIAVSPSESRVCVGTSTSIEILDSSDPDPTNWTLEHSYRGTTVPALRTPYIGAAYFTDDDTLYAFYAGSGSGVSGMVGAKFDLTLLHTDTGFMVDVYTTSGATRVRDRATIKEWGNFLLFKTYSGQFAGIPTSISYTGSYLTITNQMGGFYAVRFFYDNTNDEFLWPSSDTQSLIRVTPSMSGNTLVLTYAGSHTVSSTPYAGLLEPIEIPGAGILSAYRAAAYVNWVMWNYADQRPVGVIVKAKEGYIGTDLTEQYPIAGTVSDDGRWLIMYDLSLPSYDGFTFTDLVKAGYLKYSIFDYTPATHTLTVPTTPTWTPVANASRIGSDVNFFREPRIIADPDDNIYLTGLYQRLDAVQNPVARIFTKVEADAYRMTMRATIVARNTQTFTARARVRGDRSQTFTMMTHINFAQCVKLRARIVPFTNQTMTSRAAIYGAKSSEVLNSFYVRAQEEALMRGNFYLSNGNAMTKGASMQASIIRLVTSSAGMSFVVAAPTVGSGTIVVAINERGSQRLSARARISNA